MTMCEQNGASFQTERKKRKYLGHLGDKKTILERPAAPCFHRLFRTSARVSDKKLMFIFEFLGDKEKFGVC